MKASLVRLDNNNYANTFSDFPIENGMSVSGEYFRNNPASTHTHIIVNNFDQSDKVSSPVSPIRFARYPKRDRDVTTRSRSIRPRNRFRIRETKTIPPASTVHGPAATATIPLNARHPITSRLLPPGKPKTLISLARRCAGERITAAYLYTIRSVPACTRARIRVFVGTHE